ncbi:MAG: alpha-ketoacid dehydrogenase subunit beta [Firmicutes bacterium HGW-Firmicutes-15]|nr:MAG: alpha-ketoacid dehydrogenase subunit beta [Firmicutes bacterium HGW-Firmicutes-15]
MPWTKLVADQRRNFEPVGGGGCDRVLTYGEAISEAMEQAMEIDPRVIILGEGVSQPGFIYNTTRSICKRYGTKRVIETPIAEAALTGVTLGASLAGLRPVLIHMRCDFLLVSMDQIINHIAHWKRVFGNDTPLVIRAVIARGWGSGAQHSQSFHSLFASFEGLEVLMPATPYDIKGLFLSAVASPKPVLFLEHRWLYGDRDYVPRGTYLVPLGKAVLREEGSDITLIGMSLTNRDIYMAREKLKSERIFADWIDLRSINPIDLDTIYSSVAKTGRLLIVENGPVCCGIGAEIASRVMENCWDFLKTPVQRIGWPSATVPAGPELERQFYPGVDQILTTIRKMVT